MERMDSRHKPGHDESELPARAWCASRLPAAVLDVRHFVEMRVDVLGQPLELAPLLAEFRRSMRRLQQLAALPLDVVDDAFSIEAAMQHDGYEPRLARHEPGPVLHQRQGFVLLVRLGLDHRDLRDELIVGSNFWHAAPRVCSRRGRTRTSCSTAGRPENAGVAAGVPTGTRAAAAPYRAFADTSS